MSETPADLERLQALLDRSYAAAGAHLASIHTPECRMTAADLAGLLQGVRILALATVTADGRPLARPVDGLFHRGEFWFGSGPGSLLMRHLRRRPAVSAVYDEGESLAVTVHGTAEIVDLAAPDTAAFRDLCIRVYGPGWEEWGAEAVYARLRADRMFAFRFEGAAP